MKNKLITAILATLTLSSAGVMAADTGLELFNAKKSQVRSNQAARVTNSNSATSSLGSGSTITKPTQDAINSQGVSLTDLENKLRTEFTNSDNSLKSKITSANTSLSQNKTQINNSLTSLESSANTKINNLKNSTNSKLSTTTNNTNAISGRVTTANGNLNQLDTRIAALEAVNF